jgi:type II secretory pathway component GspD/PulD (secretin)
MTVVSHHDQQRRTSAHFWTRKSVLALSVGGVLVLTLAIFWATNRKAAGLVTLDVHDMDVREVITAVAHQTGSSIVLSSAVHGKVSLYVHAVPVDVALELIARQTDARPGHVYPVYRSPTALVDLKNLIGAQTGDAQNFPRWTNFVFHHASKAIGDPKKKLNVHVPNREARLAAQAVSVAVQSQVVVEDGVVQPVTLDLTHTSEDATVDRFAKALQCRWSSFYYLRPAHIGHAAGTTEQQRVDRKEAKLEALSAEKRARKEQFQALPSAEKEQLKEQRAADPAFQEHVTQHMLNDLRSASPEELVEHSRHAAKPKKASKN